MSITHHHICAVIHTETKCRAPGPLRILDVGCGNGRLIAEVQTRLPQLQAGRELEIHGFDVSDSKIQHEGYFDETLAFLAREHPAIDWSRRLTRITTSDLWPYNDHEFDIVMSNQVLEHVHDHNFVFNEMSRVLAGGGKSVNVFPLRSCLNEVHLNVPFAHWANDRDGIARRVKFWNGLGIGKYAKERRRDETLQLDDYALASADYVMTETNYPTTALLRDGAQAAGLGCTFSYSGGLYHNKLRTLLGRPIKYDYQDGAWENVTLTLYSLLPSVTMILTKE